MKPIDLPLPFRWDLRKRSTVEALLDGEVAPSYAGFTDDLLASCARIVAMSQGADLCFVGRSLDSVFDHLGGLLLDTSWQSRLELLPLSLWRSPDHALDTPKRQSIFKDYLRAQDWDPGSIARRENPVALADLVSSGSTLGGIVTFLHAWSEASGVDWRSVARKVRIVGLTRRTKTSPNTRRWEQHSPWVSLLGRNAIKNVSATPELYRYLGDNQPKLSRSFAPDRWGDPRVESPDHEEPHLQALRLAVRLFDLGRAGSRREAFATELAKQPAMKASWLRSLVVEIRKKA